MLRVKSSFYEFEWICIQTPFKSLQFLQKSKFWGHFDVFVGHRLWHCHTMAPWPRGLHVQRRVAVAERRGRGQRSVEWLRGRSRMAPRDGCTAKSKDLKWVKNGERREGWQRWMRFGKEWKQDKNTKDEMERFSLVNRWNLEVVLFSFKFGGLLWLWNNTNVNVWSSFTVEGS